MVAINVNVTTSRYACFLLTILGSFVAGVVTPAMSAESSPNIIYIMVDDLGYGDLGCYGQEVIKTPHLDQMAAEGMRFTDHYAGHTVCRPSRLVLWTGRHVGHTGLIGNASRSLSGREATIPRLLKRAGYATGGVGKWALGHVETPEEIHNDGHPLNNGFDYWFGYMNQSNAHNYYPEYLWENYERVRLPGNEILDDPQARGRVSKSKQTYSHDVMTDAAFEFIKRHHDDPFLLHIHWTIPHANNEAGRVSGDGMEVPDYGRYQDEPWPNPEKGFAAMVTRMDADVGRLIGLLKELEIDEQTLVLFTSDNGPHHEGGHVVEFFDSNGPLRGAKRSMHDGGIRVPLIARWPGKIAAGTETDLPSAAWDFLPTACEVADVTPPDKIDGISYLPTLLGNEDQQQRHEYLYWASSEGETSIGVRHDEWKLVMYPDGGNPRSAKSRRLPRSDGQWKLYDLSDDIGEDNNIAEQNPEVVEEITRLLRRDDLLK